MTAHALRQCMGGWCRLRDRCAHYAAELTPGLEPSERLCEPGHDEPLPVKAAEHRAKLAADPRFALWAAG